MIQLNTPRLLQMLISPWLPFQTLILDKLDLDMNTSIVGLMLLLVLSGYYQKISYLIEIHYSCSVSVSENDDVYCGWMRSVVPSMCTTATEERWNCLGGPYIKRINR